MRELFPGRALVGYESGPELAEMLAYRIPEAGAVEDLDKEREVKR